MGSLEAVVFPLVHEPTQPPHRFPVHAFKLGCVGADATHIERVSPVHPHTISDVIRICESHEDHSCNEVLINIA